MKQGQTNLGKKEQRQLNQGLTKAAQGDETKSKVVEKNRLSSIASKAA